MGNKIYFKATENRPPVQEDPVNPNENVKFYCNEKFWIEFDEGEKAEIAAMEEGRGFKVDPKGESLKLEAEEMQNGEWLIDVKFRDIPPTGLKYTVIDARNGRLDPRVVPPR